MKKKPIFPFKTDLADESHEYSDVRGGEPEGIKRTEKKIGDIRVTELCITSKRGEKLCGKPTGRYVTAELSDTVFYGAPLFEAHCETLSRLFASFLDPILEKKDGCVLLAGLGNPAILADSVGPETVRNFIVTRHIKRSSPHLYESFGFRETAAVVPDVFGNTGIEAAETLRGVVDSLRPDCIIAVDALSSRRLSRLSSAVQICDTGVCPGSGVGNRRMEISEETLGVPVIAVGVPTVVNASSLLNDSLTLCGVLPHRLSEETKRELREQIGDDCYVAPKDCGSGIAHIARMIGYALNAALHKSIAFSEMPDFL